MVEVLRRESILIDRAAEAERRDSTKGDAGSRESMKERRESMMKKDIERRESIIKDGKIVIHESADPRAQLVDHATAEVAAQMIEDEALSYLITDPVLSASLKQDSKHLFQAKCWGQEHQGESENQISLIPILFSSCFVLFFLSAIIVPVTIVYSNQIILCPR